MDPTGPASFQASAPRGANVPDSTDGWLALQPFLVGDELGLLRAALEGPPGLAAFDADGTLWDGDVGEALLLRLAEEDRLLAPHPEDPFAEYARRVRVDPADGFAYAGRLMAGLPIGLVEALAEGLFAARFDPAIFPFMRLLPRALAAAGWEVWIVSASNVWSVLPGARRLGIAPERVIALELETDAGRLLDRVRLPVPTLAGKPALLRARAGRAPALAFGNSRLDLPLLEAAGLAVAVGPRAVETPLLAEAARRSWPRLRVDATP